jgi:ribosome-binding protein aMBF1 (putative translation factor)
MKCKDPWCDQCERFGEDAVVRSRSKRVKKLFRRLKSKRQRHRDKRELLTNET